MILSFEFLTVTIAASIVKPALAYTVLMLHSPQRGDVIPLGMASPFFQLIDIGESYE